MNYRIAVIEDNPADTFLLEEALVRAGINYSMETIEDGEHAAMFIRETGQDKPDLFILDLNLPKIKGADILRLIERQADLANVPVIVWSSSDLPKDREAIALSRVSTFLVKPNTLDGFLEIGMVIRKILRMPDEAEK
jgi:CheY-like chemotaxis protein